MKPIVSNIQFVFDVESIGLHGDPFAVAVTVVKDGQEIDCICYAVDPETAAGDEDDRKWCRENIPPIKVTHDFPGAMIDAFWGFWIKWKAEGAQMFAECCWPVEAGFLRRCIKQDPLVRKWSGPYPLHEIASFMAAAGMDPMASYPYQEGDKKHDPLADARQSARLLHQALSQLSSK